MKKRILITGASSYIGTSFRKWAALHSKKYRVDAISLRDDSWKEKDFSGYDVVLHLAGIAHVKETEELKPLYYKVNCDLAFAVARKAKEDDVKQFIFMSSMSVYGMDSGVINKETPLNPKSSYGKSKLSAEKLISCLEDDSFKVAILRPPMIYGEGCKGNYQRLAKFSKNAYLFPEIENQRSMLHTDNLCKFITLLINNCDSGLFFPQNSEYVCTSDMVRLIARVNGKKIWLTRVFNPLLKVLNNDIANKVFGDLVYEQGLSRYEGFEPFSTEVSIRMTEI